MKKAFLFLILFFIFSIPQMHLGNLYPTTDTEQRMIEDLKDGNLDSFKLEEAALIASDIPSSKINDYLLKINNICNEIQQRAGRENEKRIAKAAFKYMRSETLKKYSWSSSSLSDILDSGTFNCVTATLLYNIICSKLGLKVTAIEVPFHTFSRVYVGEKAIDVELLPGG